MPCRPLPTPVEPEILIPWPFRIVNMTVANGNLLKTYFWESFDIDGLNKKLESGEKFMEHEFVVPTRQMNTRFLKVILWLECIDEFELEFKRIKNCTCSHQETRVGFNQFRNLYLCPHRHMVNIIQEIIRTKGNNEIVALSSVIYFYLVGQQRLSFEMKCKNEQMNRMLHFHFLLDVIGFDPEKTILTKNILPTKLSEYRRFVQPIWINNITMDSLFLIFNSQTTGLKILNRKLSVPRQSVWPLMIEYRPNDYENELEIIQKYRLEKTKTIVTANGYIEEPKFENTTPIEDFGCKDFAYVIYPNRLEFNAEVGEERSLMVAIHNYNQICVEFQWQNYVLSELFSVNYEPEVFRLKPHHSKLIVVHLRAYQTPLHFQRVPIVLEVHRVFDRATKIANQVLKEIESIDDSNWCRDSYIQHVFLQLDVKVNFPKEKIVELHLEPSPQPPTIRLSSTNPLEAQLPTQPTTPTPPKNRITIFEQLFWEHLSHSNYMRENENPKISESLSYKEVLDVYTNPPRSSVTLDIDKNGILKVLSLFVAESLRDISKNWIFVPVDAYLRST